MSNQSPSTSYVTNCSVTGNNNLIGFKPIKTFKWTKRLEKYLLLYMKHLNPSGINKHLSMLLLKEKMSKKFKFNIPIKVLWKYMSTKWDIKVVDRIENIRFDTSEKDFVLPKDFDQLIDEEGEKIKNLSKECLNDKINERKSLNWSGKTRSNSNSMPSVDLKEEPNEMTLSVLLENSPAKTNGFISDDVPCTRRSLHTNNKLENSKSDGINKLKDLKQLNKKTLSKSKSMEEIEKISNIRERKRESSHVSESSFSSDNSKRLKNYKNNLTDSTISNSLSKSVSPDMLRGINEHLSMLLLKEKMSKKFKFNIPIKVLWKYMSTKWDIKVVDRIENIRFDTSEKDFVLPKDFDQLIDEEGEKIKNLSKECLNDEINERKSLNWSGKTRSNSNSMPSVDFKEEPNEMTLSVLLENSPAKTNGVISDDVPCTRRSLHTNNKIENSKSDGINKLKDLKQLNKKTLSKSKSTEEIEKISNIRERKRESSIV